MKHKKSIFLFFRKYFLSPNIHSYFILAKKAWLAILNFSWFIVSYYLLSNSWLFINLYESLVFIKLFYRRNQWLLLSFPMYILCNNECVLFYISLFREKKKYFVEEFFESWMMRKTFKKMSPSNKWFSVVMLAVLSALTDHEVSLETGGW